jgi:uncharacterized protein (TIGR03118 family)
LSEQEELMMRNMALTAAGLLLLGTTCVLADDEGTYIQTNLVSNVVGQAGTTDSNLQNAWGVANAPNSPLWVSDNNDGLSTLYDGNGNKLTLAILGNTNQVKIPVPPGTNPPAAPTGMVWNPNSGTQFLIPNSQAGAIFIWDTENGTIAGWNPAVNPTSAVIIVDNSNGGKNGAVYKGLAFGTNVHGNFLFATNFRAGTVEAYDVNFKLMTLDGSFTDPEIPAGFAPFGIANVNGDLFVTYARQNANKDDVVAGAGEGFVDVFSTDGKLLRRFASRGVLNAPWGVTRAPLGFGRFSGDILIGNFGNAGQFAGWINAFDSRGNLEHELRNQKGQPISIDGLWSLVFGTFLRSDSDTLYFTAGPNNQTNGLFGKIVPAADKDDLATAN